MADIDIDASIRIVREMCEGGNGVFHDACLAVCAEIERLRAAGDRLARYMAMDHYPEDCEDDCESLAAWRAWQEARRG